MTIENELFNLALNARTNAYAPYSGFAVGAAILASEKAMFSGCNVENVSYPCGTCAETGAIAAMVAAGYRQIKAILIIADTDEIRPCGNCLQKISEFATPETLIYCANLQQIVKTYRLIDLLPQQFSFSERKDGK